VIDSQTANLQVGHEEISQHLNLTSTLQGTSTAPHEVHPESNYTASPQYIYIYSGAPTVKGQM
jgi:hypothetical protein